MYSLVSPSVLGYDLCRLPGGAEVAAVLLRALALGPADLPRLLPPASGAPADREALVVARAGATDAASRIVSTGDALTAAVEGLADAGRRRVALALLEQAAIGTLDGLARLVRHDVLDWAQDPGPPSADRAAGEAVEVVVDAAVAGFTRGLVEPSVTDCLAARWRAALPSLPPPAPVPGPSGERVEVLLGRASRLDAADLERLQIAADAARPGGGSTAADWAPAMHSATWAVHLAERLRPAAAAQLRLVAAVHGRVPPDCLARGCWSTLSGAVQAEVVRDLLDPETHEALAGGALLALGLPA